MIRAFQGPSRIRVNIPGQFRGARCLSIRVVDPEERLKMFRHSLYTKRNVAGPSTIKLFEQLNPDQYKSFTPGMFNLMMGVYRAHEPRKALELFDKIVSMGLASGTATYNQTLSICAEDGQTDRAWSIFSTMKKTKLEDVVTYNTMLSILSKKGDHQRALLLYEEMLAAKIGPTVVTLNILLKIYGKTNQEAKANDLFETMKTQGLADVISFNTMLQILASNHRRKKALALYREMETTGPSPSIATKNLMLSVYGINPHFFQHLKKTRFINQQSYAMMLNEYAKADRVDEALHLWKEIQNRYGIKIEAPVFATIIGICIKARKFTEAMDFFQEMMNSGIQPSEATLSAILHIYFEEGRFVKLIQLAEQMMQEMGIQPNPKILNKLVTAYASTQQEDKATALYTFMIEEHIPVNIYIFTTMITIFGRRKDYNRVAEVLQQMANQNVSPNLTTFGTVLSFTVLGIVEPEIEHLALAGFEAWHKVFDGNVVLYTIMIQRYYFRGEHEKAMELFEEMKKRGYTPDGRLLAMIKTVRGAIKDKELQALVAAQQSTARLINKKDF